MISPRKYQAAQRVLLYGSLCLVLYLFLVFLPLCEHVAALDKPLQDAWQNVANTPMVAAGNHGVDFTALDKRLRELEVLSRQLSSISNTFLQRVNLDRSVRERIRQSFQHVDFQNERQWNLEELQRLARDKQVAVAPAVLRGYPEYSTDLKNPELLWGHLAVVQEVLVLAVKCQVTSIHTLNVRTPRPIAGDEIQTSAIYELPVTVQVSGPMPCIARFMACLPLRTDETRNLGITDVSPTKPAFFIDRVLLRKETPEKPEVVRAELRITGMVYRD